MSCVVDASAVLALHFGDGARQFAALEEHLMSEGQAFTAPNFFQEVMEVLRRGIRQGRTTREDVAAWLPVLDQFRITPVRIHPCAASATWIIAETLNVSAYDAGYLAVAKETGLPIFSLDEAIIRRAPEIGVAVNPRRLRAERP